LTCDKLIEDNDIAGKDIGVLSGYITEQIQQESALTVQLAQARVDSERSLERFEMIRSILMRLVALLRISASKTTLVVVKASGPFVQRYANRMTSPINFYGSQDCR